MKHILTVDQFDTDQIRIIVEAAANHRFLSSITRNYYSSAQGRILANLFYEPSTRTSSSFYSAMVRLGGNVIPINDVTFSSVVKGETLEDTIRTLECYSDVIVLRHKEIGAAQRAAVVSSVPIINAGDGIGEHPTQALLDFFTILIERGWDQTKNVTDIMNNSLSVSMMGDLKHGRTVKSLAKLLRKYGVKINWISPIDLRIPIEYLQKDVITDDLNEVIHSTDVLYLTRTQLERFDESSISRPIEYGITLEHMSLAKKDMVLMHPLPRTNELPTELDSDPRSAYFRQMKYGLYIRMALLEMVLAQ